MASLFGSHSSIGSFLASSWEVLILFLIPVGGGIPGGVLLAKSRGLAWPIMLILYFISDVILACVFEPLMLLLIAAGKRAPFLARLGEAMKKSVQKTTANFGTRLGPLALILVSFSVDPMTGRAAAAAAGHGFVRGWALSITGDLFFFAMLMASTLWLNGILGDETKTTAIILIAMFVLPPLIRKVREKFRHPEG